jgi:hypothetical protein
MAQQPLAGQGLFIINASRHTQEAPHSVGLLWTSDQPDAGTHNTRKRQISLPLAGFEPTIPASERPQTHALDRAPTGIGYTYYM